MSQDNINKQAYVRKKFKTFVCFSKNDEEKARVLESVLGEKGFDANLIDIESHGNFISTEIKDLIRSSICFIAIFSSNLLNSRLVNQVMGFAQGKGLKIILLVSSKIKDELQDVQKNLIVMEFNEENFRQQCSSVADRVGKIAEILDEPVDVESFLDFYTRNKHEV